MSKQVDRAILLSFVDEARSYLPSIYEGIAVYQSNETEVEQIQLAYRQIHTITGASSMVGLSDLSHMACEIENVLEEFALVQGTLSAETAADLRLRLTQIEQMLNDITEEEITSEEIPEEVPQESYLSVDHLQKIDHKDTKPVVDPVSTSSELDEIDAEMLSVFSMEAEDHLRTISRSLVILDKDYDNREVLQEMRRSVHTLKGAAGVVGLKTITRLSHRMEDLLDRIYEGQIANTSETMKLMLSSTDVIEALSQGVEKSRVESTLNQLYEQYSNLLDQTVDLQSTEIQKAQSVDDLLAARASVGVAKLEQTTEEPVEIETAGQTVMQNAATRMVRVPLDKLDDLVKLVSEMVISRTVLEQRMTALEQQAGELDHSVERLRRVSNHIESDYEASSLMGRTALRGVAALPLATKLNGNGFHNGHSLSLAQTKTVETYGFDELEFDRYTDFHRLSRELSETTSDTNSIGNELKNLVGDFDGIMTRQRRLTSEIQEKLMRLRMVPLGSLASRLERAVRVAADKQGKLADLILEGENIELDTMALTTIADPLLHLLRNSVAHGIEPQSVRRVRGKSDRGHIRLRAYHEGTQVVIEVSDDGQGIDQQALKAKAISEGLISQQQAALLSDDETLSLIFLHGLSTATEVSEVSGRGVGMDVVKETITKLKGTLALDSVPGRGVKFTIRLPMTMSVTRALIIKVHGESYAIPLNAVTQLLRVENDEIEKLAKDQVLWIGGKLYPVIRLGEFLNVPASGEVVNRPPVLLVKTGVDNIALVVDEIVEGREIVIKSLGTHLKNVPGLLGSTILGDGRVVPILNPSYLARRSAETQAKPAIHNQRLQQREKRDLNVLIVDDSPSVRRVMLGLMNSVGWQSRAAKDGLDALETLQSSPSRPDAILLDVEMPRMDGYELLSTLKKQEAFREIPVIMITSRTGEKHKQKALDLGASEYIAKPYQDDILLNTIRKLVQ